MKKRHLFLGILLLLICMPLFANAATHTYYVSGTGDNSATGEQSTPLATITRAIALAEEDDVVNIELSSDLTENVIVNKKMTLNIIGNNYVLNGSIGSTADEVTANISGLTIKAVANSFLVAFPNRKNIVRLTNCVIDGAYGESSVVSIPIAIQQVYRHSADTPSIINWNFTDQELYLNNVEVKNYLSKAMYISTVSVLEVKNSKFDATGTLHAQDVAPNELMKRSAAAIDINFGDWVEGNATYNYDIIGTNLKRITIENNEFYNVQNTTVDSEGNYGSTAGAIKIKLKNLAATNREDYKIEIVDNKFTDNFKDVVVGTNTGITYNGTTLAYEAENSANLNIDFSGNYNVTDNVRHEYITLMNNADVNTKTVSYDAKTIKISNVLDATYNGYTKVTTVESNNDDATVINASSVNDLTTQLNVAKENEKDLLLTYEDVYITIAAEDIKENLTGAIKNLEIKIGELPEELDSYDSEDVIFITSTASGILPASKITVNIPMDVEYEGDEFEVFYYNEETKKLESVGKFTVEDEILSVELTHYSSYLIQLAPEPEPTNPSTNDAIMKYIFIGSVSLLCIAGSAIYLNKKKLLN